MRKTAIIMISLLLMTTLNIAQAQPSSKLVLYGQYEPYTVAASKNTTLYFAIEENGTYIDGYIKLKIYTSASYMVFDGTVYTYLENFSGKYVYVAKIVIETSVGKLYAKGEMYDKNGTYLGTDTIEIEVVSLSGDVDGLWSIQLPRNIVVGEIYTIKMFVATKDLIAAQIIDPIGNKYMMEINETEEGACVHGQVSLISEETTITIELIYTLQRTVYKQVTIEADKVEKNETDTLLICDNDILIFRTDYEGLLYGKTYVVGYNTHITINSCGGKAFKGEIKIDIRNLEKHTIKHLFLTTVEHRIIITDNTLSETNSIIFNAQKVGKIFTDVRISRYNTYKELYGLIAKAEVVKKEDGKYEYSMKDGSKVKDIRIVYKK